MASEQRGPIVCDNPDTQDVIEDALRNLWAVTNDLSRIRPAEQASYRVTIFGSARIQAGQPLYEDVKRLARELSLRGCDIVTGGGPGLMQAANEGCQLGDPDQRVSSIGVRIQLPFERGANPFVEQLYSHQTFYTRLHQFVRLSSAFVVISGGIGTTLETMMIWQLLQVRHLSDVPLIFVGPMWRGLVDWAREHMTRGAVQYASPRDMDIPVCVDNVDEALATLLPLLERKPSQTTR